MPKPLHNARLKIDRANKHITDADVLVRAWQSPEFQFVREEINPQTGDKLLHYGFVKPLPFEDLALLIGDAIHNLRTALDYAWLATLKKFAPSRESEFSKFPVYEFRKKVDAGLKGAHIHTACPKLYDLLLSQIRPYREGGNHFIWAIHRLDIRDKHMLLLPLLSKTSLCVVEELERFTP
jgi:hypothetical protein